MPDRPEDLLGQIAEFYNRDNLRLANAVRSAGWQPDRHVIEDADELLRLPSGTVLRDSDGAVFEAERGENGCSAFWATKPWDDYGRGSGYDSVVLVLPAVVLHTPENGGQA